MYHPSTEHYGPFTTTRTHDTCVYVLYVGALSSIPNM